MFLDLTVGGPSRIQATLQTPTPSPDMSEHPLFEPDTSSPIVQDQPIVEHRSPSPLLLLPCQDDPEFQAKEEMREQFQWLVDVLGQNEKRSWGTGYRDFSDVSCC